MSNQEPTNEATEGQSQLTEVLGADGDSAEERYIHEALHMLANNYEKARRPYIARLMAIHNMRPPAPIFVTREQAEEMGF